MTRKERWESLPEGLRVNEHRFREVLDDGEGTEWEKEGGKGTLPATYEVKTATS